ncbi:MAG: hypothetical protein ABIG93_04820 [archaeon]
MKKATITGELPGGFIGDLGQVYQGIVEGSEVALKISRHAGEYKREAWEKELRISKELSILLPDTTARYFEMVEVEGFEKFPAFSMEVVRGYTVIDRNIGCLQGRAYHTVVNENTVEQLRSSLEKAVSLGWHPGDVQYFILAEDQVLNGRPHVKGDLILFDFSMWGIDSDGDVDLYVRKLERLVGG